MITRFTAEEYGILCRIASIGLETADTQDKKKMFEKAAAQLTRDFQYSSGDTYVEVELEGSAKKALMNGIHIVLLAMQGDYELLQSAYGVNSVKLEHFLRWKEDSQQSESVEVSGKKNLHGFDPETLKVLKKQLKKKQIVPERKMYISDLHFYHDGLNHRMDSRGFADANEMNAYMIRQWNSKVGSKDEVYILGDLSIGKGKDTNEILDQLNGKLYLIEGNHDKFLGDKEFDASRFGWVKPYAEIRDHKRKVILSHYPVFCYVGQYRKMNGVPDTYMLYGHVHDTYDEVLVNQFIQITRNTKRMSKYSDKPEPIPCNMINCFCMYSDYVPLTLDEWIVLDERRREGMQYGQ